MMHQVSNLHLTAVLVVPIFYTSRAVVAVAQCGLAEYAGQCRGRATRAHLAPSIEEDDIAGLALLDQQVVHRLHRRYSSDEDFANWMLDSISPATYHAPLRRGRARRDRHDELMTHRTLASFSHRAPFPRVPFGHVGTSKLLEAQELGRKGKAVPPI